ncbi:MAG: alpha/beta fold hydrolase [Chloroflexota bacterium]|nr:alpha/beta fold hydrolase [Chloroflexota bacterium]
MKKAIKKTVKGFAWGTSGLLSGMAAAVAGWILFSRKYIRHDMPLDKALDADRHDFFSQHAGRISYYASTSDKGTPLVLLHSINAAPSAYEMKPLFEHYQGQRPVYALDLPGFGWSERSDRLYSPQLYQHAIHDFLKEVVKKPADVIGLSLSCEFAARAAVLSPDLFRSLVMISPTGFNPPRMDKFAQSAARSGARNTFYTGLAVPLWNRPLYDLVTVRPSIHYFLNKVFEGLVPEEFVDYAYQTAHQPGAQYAPTFFLSGKLFTPAVRETVYMALKPPVLAIYDHGPFTNYDMLPMVLRECKNWKGVRISPTRGLPHWEEPQRLFNTLNNFWAGL